jgi:hypothetical protein
MIRRVEAMDGIRTKGSQGVWEYGICYDTPVYLVLRGRDFVLYSTQDNRHADRRR